MQLPNILLMHMTCGTAIHELTNVDSHRTRLENRRPLVEQHATFCKLKHKL